MNKKIIALLSLLVIVVGISAVSAFDFGDLIGGDSADENVTIDGIDFKLPSGFEENSSFESVNEKASVGSVDYTYCQKLFEKDGTAVSILVADYGEYKVTDEIVAAIGGEKETVGGIDGYSDYENGIYSFSFAKNDKLITITSSDKDVIGDFLIAE